MEWFVNLGDAAQVGLVSSVLTVIATILSALVSHWTTLRTVSAQSKQSFREKRARAYSDFISAAMKYTLSLRCRSTDPKGEPFGDPALSAEFLSCMVIAQSFASARTQSQIIRLENAILFAAQTRTAENLSDAMISIQLFSQSLSKELKDK